MQLKRNIDYGKHLWKTYNLAKIKSTFILYHKRKENSIETATGQGKTNTISTAQEMI